MTFFEVVCANIFGMFLSTIFYVWFAIILLGQIPYKNVRHQFVIFLSLMLDIVVISVIGAGFYKSGLFALKYNIGENVVEYIQIAGIMLILWVMYSFSGEFEQKFYGKMSREKDREMHGRAMSVYWVTAVLISILQSFGWNLSELFSPDVIFNLAKLSDLRIYLFYEWIVTPLCTLLVVFVLYKSGMGKLYRQWSECRKKKSTASWKC